ncbi:ABC transporter substrate-binding protein [Pandoraea cepalis]|uniref:ABC transporter substrate-binding protein n=1 Tax=Pandoraea cepalis TaxID=2508294 RepID=UPI00263B4CE0|nr:ABC transporter substrate-binding protein [Pandoraea cepalis]
MRIGFVGGGANDAIDPHAMIGPSATAAIQTIFQQVTQIGPDFKLRNVLAEEITSNAKLDQWDVRLKKGVEFHNGKTLGARDLIFTLRRILDPKSPGYAAGQLAFIDPSAMTELDDHTVRFKLKLPYSLFATTIGDGGILGIVPEGYTGGTPIGTGMFKLKSFAPGQQIVLERFANYAGAKAPLSEIVLLNFNDHFARINALISGQIDVAQQVPVTMLKMLGKAPDIATQTSHTGLFNPFSMRTDTGPFKDVRVRQAMRLLVDREQVRKQAFLGNATICHDLYSPFDSAYDKSLVRQHDPAQAKALLRQAGQSDLRVQLLIAPVRYGMLEAAQVIANQARAIGVTIDIKKLEPSAARSSDVQNAPFTFGLFPGLTYLTMASISDGPYSTLNTSRFNTPEFTTLYNQSRGEGDAAKRADLFKQMQRIQFDQGGYLFPVFPDTVDAFHKRVKGVTPDATGTGIGRAEYGKLSLA